MKIKYMGTVAELCNVGEYTIARIYNQHRDVYGGKKYVDMLCDDDCTPIVDYHDADISDKDKNAINEAMKGVPEKI